MKQHENVTNPGIGPASANEWVPLLETRRNGLAESCVYGALSWFSGGKLIYSYGGDQFCYFRSLVKPFHIKLFAKELDSVLSWEQKAIAVASHNGEDKHIEVAQSLLNESDQGLMQTPLATPLMQFGAQKRRPRRWYHTCSGNHAAILRGCQLKGWSRVGYIWPQHPLHQNYLAFLRKQFGAEWEPAFTARDGSGLPSTSLRISEMAALYSWLVQDRKSDWIWEAMLRNPDLVGGFNRLDSTILKSCHGKVIAKEGADGLLGIAIEHPKFPQGLGIVIKISHGWDGKAAWHVARWTLGVLGFDLRNPYRLHRQKVYMVDKIIPPEFRKELAKVEAFDSWDPDTDKWDFSFENYIHSDTGMAE